MKYDEGRALLRRPLSLTHLNNFICCTELVLPTKVAKGVGNFALMRFGRTNATRI